MPCPICLVAGCRQAAAVAAMVRVHGASIPWLLCDDHAILLSHPDLPGWCEVDRVRTISDIYPAVAEQAASES